MNYIDSFLNKITMYRLVLLYLCGLLFFAFVLSILGIISYSPISILFSVAVLFVASALTNSLCAKVWNATPGNASYYITALILAAIITPVSPGDLQGTLTLVIIAIWAMASKYLFAIGRKHLFNSAALAAALAGLFLSSSASWWVAGNSYLMPLILVGGLLIVRKIQRFDMVLAFIASSLLSIALVSPGDPLQNIWLTLLHVPVLFLAFTMLTDPATTPPTRDMRIAYGILVGIWFTPAVHIASFYFSPELALLLGNVFVYIVSPKGRFSLVLKEKKEIAKNTFEFIFTPRTKKGFASGQYLEWTLPAKKNGDAKGNRRYFTIASSPTESDIRIGVRMTDLPSSFKQSLLGLSIGDVVTAAGLAGDFTLPRKKETKLAFIAGGIGITPFRSMAQYLLDTEKRDVVLFYSNKTADEVAYREIFEKARSEIDMKTIYTLTRDTTESETTHLGRVDADLIRKTLPDFKERTFYISGPRSMILSFERTLRELGIHQSKIRTDYFSGLA